MFRLLTKSIAPVTKSILLSTAKYNSPLQLNRAEIWRASYPIGSRRSFAEQKAQQQSKEGEEPITPYQPVTEKLDKRDPNYPWKVSTPNMFTLFSFCCL
jgi:ubiquinol oxidase